MVTHVDRDHIEGVLSLMKDDSQQLKVNNIWFNGWYHLIGTTPAPPAPVEPVTALDPDEPAPVFGAVMGEELSPLIQQKAGRGISNLVVGQSSYRLCRTTS